MARSKAKVRVERRLPAKTKLPASTKLPSKARLRANTKLPPKKKSNKMKAYASFDLYLADQPPKNQTIIRALRKFVKRTLPELEESVKWSNGCWLQGKVPVAYVYAAPEFTQFGFIRGSSLADPRGLLEGEGQYVRFIKVRELADIDERAFAALLRQAAR
jgi:hypothetical protein